MRYKAVVMGVSAGGIDALKTILPSLPASFPLPIAVVQHRDRRSDGFLAEYLDGLSRIVVKDAEDKEPLRAGCAYLAPANYHLLVEPEGSLSLSVDPRVNYSRPSIDVLFESAANAFQGFLIGVVLTGANSDGAQGLNAIKKRGGLAIVQDPATAEVDAMPKAALAATTADYVLPLTGIAALLERLGESNEEGDDADG